MNETERTTTGVSHAAADPRGSDGALAVAADGATPDDGSAGEAKGVGLLASGVADPEGAWPGGGGPSAMDPAAGSGAGRAPERSVGAMVGDGAQPATASPDSESPATADEAVPAEELAAVVEAVPV
ncbi:hypothetical protein U9R90_35260, partial [Streptomyces sp. E11-3]